MTALTGPRVIEKIDALSGVLDEVSAVLEVKSHVQVLEKVKKLTKELDEAQSKVESLETQVIISLLKSENKRSNQDFDVIMELPASVNFKALSSLARQEFADKNMYFYTQEGNFLILTSGAQNAKEIAQKLGLK